MRTYGPPSGNPIRAYGALRFPTYLLTIFGNKSLARFDTFVISVTFGVGTFARTCVAFILSGPLSGDAQFTNGTTARTFVAIRFGHLGNIYSI